MNGPSRSSRVDPRFRAFSFVDRIFTSEPGAGVRGLYNVPAGLDDFPGSLVAEAVGQLAAWGAMATVDFTCRPVAGIASRIELLKPVQPGQVLELRAELETVDAENVAYNGCALVDGTPVIRLHDCIGPMLPMTRFDDADLVRDRYAVVCGGGGAPGGFTGLPAIPIEREDGGSARSARAHLRVPASAPFFADHFPREPVFPGTLLMHAKLQVAMTLAAELPSTPPGRGWIPCSVSGMKLRAFIPPGEALVIQAKVVAHSVDSVAVEVTTLNSQRPIGRALVSLGREEPA